MLSPGTPVLTMEGADARVEWYNALVDVRIEREFRLPGRAVLRFHDHEGLLATDSHVKLGGKIAVGSEQGPDVIPLFEGVITGLGLEQGARGSASYSELVLVAHDGAERLLRGTSVKNFNDSTISDLVSGIASRHGLTAQVDSTPLVLEYVLQVESDFALLEALADRCGYDWWVEGTALHFKKPSSSGYGPGKTVKLGDDLVEFVLRASGLHADTVEVRGWNRKTQQEVTASASASGAGRKATGAMATPFASPGRALAGSATLTASGVVVENQGEAQAAADSLRDELVADAVTASGIALGGAKIALGTLVTVEQAGPASGSYHVTKLEHRYSSNGRHSGAFETHFTAGSRRPTSLVDAVKSGRPTSASLQHHGLVVGTVTNVKDPLSSGRVKVKFPGLSNTTESGWARVVTLGGGAKRGLVVLPETEDEVLVGFENGDRRQPVVLGGLFGDKSSIPLWDVKGGKVEGRRLTSRLGHVVELKDGEAAAEQHVLLQLAGEKHRIRLGKDACDIEVPSGVPFSIKVGDNASMTFDASGNLKVKAVNISLDATGSFETSSKVAKVVSEGPLNLEGKLTTVKGTTVTVDGQAMTTIKGGVVAIN
ncbi:MAG: hypothetical protein JWO12_1222 [Frankiales bacterium]|nr:hypothetical protein [Frankiales bacterium]